MEDHHPAPSSSLPSSAIELDILNSHPIMFSILETLSMLFVKFPPINNALPGFLQPIYSELMRKELHMNIRIFLLKILLNKPEIINCYGPTFFPLFITYLSEKSTGGKGFHYFFRDIATTTIDIFNKNNFSQLFPSGMGNREKELLCKIINNMLKIAPDENKDVFRSNLDIWGWFLEKFREYVFVEKNTLGKMISIKEDEKNTAAHLFK